MVDGAIPQGDRRLLLQLGLAHVPGGAGERRLQNHPEHRGGPHREPAGLRPPGRPVGPAARPARPGSSGSSAPATWPSAPAASTRSAASSRGPGVARHPGSAQLGGLPGADADLHVRLAHAGRDRASRSCWSGSRRSATTRSSGTSGTRASRRGGIMSLRPAADRRRGQGARLRGREPRLPRVGAAVRAPRSGSASRSARSRTSSSTVTVRLPGALLAGHLRHALLRAVPGGAARSPRAPSSPSPAPSGRSSRRLQA